MQTILSYSKNLSEALRKRNAVKDGCGLCWTFNFCKKRSSVFILLCFHQMSQKLCSADECYELGHVSL